MRDENKQTQQADDETMPENVFNEDYDLMREYARQLNGDFENRDERVDG